MTSNRFNCSYDVDQPNQLLGKVLLVIVSQVHDGVAFVFESYLSSKFQS